MNLTTRNSGEVTKLKITPYKDENFKTPASESKVFEVAANPSTYQLGFTVEGTAHQALGTSGTNTGYSMTKSPDLDLDFIFDGTGLLDQNKSGNKLVNTVGEIADKIKGKSVKSGPETVVDQINRFKGTVLDYSGEEHKPYYVEILWGALFFQGTLTNLNIDFKLFSPSGYPLRAMAKAKFSGVISHELRAALENKNSPDLTHIRTVKAGDTLPLMTQRIYGDSKYYLEVAKANNIINFRQLKPGMEIVFPPIEKTS